MLKIRSRNCLQVTAACFLSCMALTTLAQSSSNSLDDAAILTLMEKESIPGLSLSVLNGQEFTLKSYGVKRVGESALVDQFTIFEAASLTKPVFALIAMKMNEEGLLDLDKPLFEYVDYQDIAHDERHRLITARMVLNHTTGFPNGRASSGLEIYVEPGTKFGYSGEAFRYLQAAIQAISGKTLDILAVEYVFGPLGMHNTSFVWREEFLENAASGHDQTGEFAREIIHLSRAYAEGGLESNISDYTRFASYILQEYQRGSSAVREMLASSFHVQDYGNEGAIDWGLGWGLDIAGDSVRAWHTGSNGAFQSFIVLDLNRNAGVIAFLNSANGLEIISEIVLQTIGGPRLAEIYQQTISDSWN